MILDSEQLSSLPSGWSGDATGISREFSFGSYAAGAAFALRVALLAEKRDHHPDALTIAWKKVRVTYVTHSADGVTDKDVRAAEEVNALFDE